MGRAIILPKLSIFVVGYEKLKPTKARVGTASFPLEGLETEQIHLDRAARNLLSTALVHPLMVLGTNGNIIHSILRTPSRN